MTVKHSQSITCLSCKKASDFDFYGSINTMLDPTLKQRVKNFDIFKFICPHCGSEQFVAYSFLYHQMEDKLMIYCCQDEEEIAKVRELYAGDFTTAVDEKDASAPSTPAVIADASSSVPTISWKRSASSTPDSTTDSWRSTRSCSTARCSHSSQKCPAAMTSTPFSLTNSSTAP